jgi:hypothetical protein
MLEQQEKKVAASTLRKKKTEEKKKREIKARNNLDRLMAKEVEEKEEEEKKKLKEEENRLKDSADSNTNAQIMRLNDMTDKDPLNVDDVDMELFTNENKDVIEELNPSIPVYKKTSGPVSSLKLTNRYGPASTPAARKTKKCASTIHTHTFFVEIGIMLKAEDKAMEWKVKIPLILTNAQLIDEHAGFVELRPTNETKPRIITEKSNFPTNHTLLGIFVGTMGVNIFAPVKNWSKNEDEKKKHRDDDENKIKPKTVYAMIHLTLNKDLKWLLNNIRTEFKAHGGTKLVVKEVQAAESKEVAIMYNILTLTLTATIQMAYSKHWPRRWYK